MLVNSLRQDPMRCHQIIVILHNLYTDDEKQKLEAKFSALYVLHGSCRAEADLEYAGFQHADRVIVLSDHVSSFQNQHPGTGTPTAASGGVALDKAAVMVSMSSCSKEGGPVIIYELVEANNAQYLHPLQQIHTELKHEYSLWGNFAAGSIWPSSALDSLICQAYYEQALLITLEALLPRLETSEEDEEPPEASEGNTRRCTVWQIPLPPSLAGKSFHCAIVSLLGASTPLQPIGVYRNPDRNLFAASWSPDRDSKGRKSSRKSARGGANTHILLERTESDLQSTGTELPPEGSMGEVATLEMARSAEYSVSPQERANAALEAQWQEQACALMCPTPDFVLAAGDVLFVLGDKREWLSAGDAQPAFSTRSAAVP